MCARMCMWVCLDGHNCRQVSGRGERRGAAGDLNRMQHTIGYS